MNPVLKLVAGAAAVAALGLAALMSDGVPGSASSAREKLRARIASELAAPDAAWAQFRLDGQKLIVSGEAPSTQARDALLARIDDADLAGGYVAGAVTAVDLSGLIVKTPVLPHADPFVWSVERSGDRLVFSGNVPNQEARDALFGLAQMLFPNAQIAGPLDIASGAPGSDEDWSEAAAAGLRALAYLQDGKVSAVGPRLSLTGEAIDGTRARAARMLIQSLPTGFIGESVVNAPAPVAETAPGTGDEIADGAAAEPENTCIADLEAAIDRRSIGFVSARFEIDPPSRTQLSEIAEVLKQCPDVRLAVTGHTDSSGSAQRNLQLSASRADAVRTYLISLGIEAERVSARGAGSTQPIASNATAAGRERNRRIEIDIAAGD